jgi:hypothetical protein
MPFYLTVQELVDGILGSDSKQSSNRRNALDVIGVKEVQRESRSESNKESISDYINQ